jgi:hypothetical protein
MENLSMETWVDVKGYEGIYMVSDQGRVMRVSKDSLGRDPHGKKRHILSPPLSCGYPRVSLFKNKIQKLHHVHRLVATAFIPNPDNKPVVNHINSVRTDNRVGNLEWCTVKENIHHGIKFGSIKVGIWKGKTGYNSSRGIEVHQFDINGNYIRSYGSVEQAGKINGLAPSNIHACLRGDRESSKSFRWSKSLTSNGYNLKQG